MDKIFNTMIESLGESHIPSPLLHDNLYAQIDFVEKYQVLSVPLIEYKNKENCNHKNIKFELSGPRKKIFFDPSKTRAGIVTCGSISPGINQLIIEIVNELYNQYGIKNIYGFRYGLQGFIPKYGHEIIDLYPDLFKTKKNREGSFIGTSRGAQDLNEIADCLERLNISILIMIGGTGSIRATSIIADIMKDRELKISIIGIPKSIDNDIIFIQKTIGFDSAIETASKIVSSFNDEIISYPNGIGIIKVPGMHSGIFAATLASKSDCVDFVLIPELSLKLEGKYGLLVAIENQIKAHKKALILVSEGAGQDLFPIEHEERDASGNIRLFNVGISLKDHISKFFIQKKIEVEIRFFEPYYVIRNAVTNATDTKKCYHLGKNAVHAAMAGKTKMVVSFWNDIAVHIPMGLILNERKYMDLNGHLWNSVLENTKQALINKENIESVKTKVSNSKKRIADQKLKNIKEFFLRSGFQRLRLINTTHEIFLLESDPNKMDGILTFFNKENSENVIFHHVKNIINNHKKKFKIYLVYFDMKPSNKQLQNFRKLYKCEIIPIMNTHIENAFIKKKYASFLKELEEPFVTKTDPYSETRPISDPNWFYGREELMRTVRKDLSQGLNVGIFGLRKIGKTSLLKQIQRRFLPTPTAFIDCQAFSPNAIFYFEEIANQLKNEIKNRKIADPPEYMFIEIDDFRKYIERLFLIWKKPSQEEPFIIILDEIDKFLPNAGMSNYKTTIEEFIKLFKVLRGLSQMEQPHVVIAVIAYRPDINRMNIFSKMLGENPMFRSFKELYLGFLERSESNDMVNEIGLWKDIVWDYEATNEIYDYCGGHPLITRYFASMACNGGTLLRVNSEKVKKTAEIIIQTFYKNEFGNYYNNGIWSLLTEDEKLVLKRICLCDDCKINIDELGKNYEVPFANLENFGIVEINTMFECSINSILFKTWLTRRLSK